MIKSAVQKDHSDYGDTSTAAAAREETAATGRRLRQPGGGRDAEKQMNSRDIQKSLTDRLEGDREVKEGVSEDSLGSSLFNWTGDASS